MSSTQPVQAIQNDARPRPTQRRRWFALATLVVGLLGCCATLLSQGFPPAHTVSTSAALAHRPAAPASQPAASATTTDLSGLKVESARQQFNAASQQMALFESTRQGQLAQLKARQADPTQAAAAQQRIAAAATACYEAAARLEDDRQLTQTLEAAQANPSVWTRIPADTLPPHSDLRRLLSELKSAQAHTARLLETRLSAHPAVQSARTAEQQIETSLQQELHRVLPERRATIQSDEQQLESLRGELQRQETIERQLAELAAEYNLYVTNVRTCEAVLRKTEQDFVASRNTHRASHPTTISVDTASSVTPPVPQTIATSCTSEASTTDNNSSGSNNRWLLIVVAGASGLFACLGYFYLTSSRPTAHNLNGVTRVGHCSPAITNAESSPANETSLAANTHFTAAPAHASSTLPTGVALSEPSRSVVCDSRAPRPTGRTTLRDALMRCAGQAGHAQ